MPPLCFFLSQQGFSAKVHRSDKSGTSIKKTLFTREPLILRQDEFLLERNMFLFVETEAILLEIFHGFSPLHNSPSPCFI